MPHPFTSAATLGLLATLPLAAFAAPANDAFASPQIIAGSLLQIEGTTVGSTTEIGENDNTYYDGTVWYSWTAPRKGYLDLAVGFLDSDYRELAVAQLTGVRTIFNLAFLADPSVSNTGQVQKLGVAGGVEYFIRVADRQYYHNGGPFTMLLSFTPIYSSAVAFSGGPSVLGRKNTISGRVSTPADVTSISVRASGAGHATKIHYNGEKGTFSFEHVRSGAGRKKTVTYVVQARHGGGVIGQAGRKYRVR